jgi:hypothetical protein
MRCLQTILFIVVASSCLLAQQKSTTTDTSKSNTVLLLKGNSYLENAVAGIVVDSLKTRGIRVKITDYKNFSQVYAPTFLSTIVFHAIRTDKTLNPVVEKFYRDKTDNGSKILVFTVYGDKLNNPPESTDAITAATSTLKPNVVALRILRIFDASMGKK